MSDIKYVCISDLHLGQNNSILSNMDDSFIQDSTRPGVVLTSLAQRLRDILQTNSPDAPKPVLILNGDCIELALSSLNEATMTFENMITQFLPADQEPLFSKIIYIPGNHDHHLWEISRETLFVENLKSVPPGEKHNEAKHSTNMFIFKQDSPIKSYLLSNLVNRYPHLNNFEIYIAYPNFAVIDDELEKCIVFHHGHYTEDIYQFMSDAMTMIFPDRVKPKNIPELEEENYAWVDFLWSTLGRSGQAGKLAASIYDSLKVKPAIKKLLGNFISNVVEKINGDNVSRSLKLFYKISLNKILSNFVSNLSNREKFNKETIMSAKSRDRLSFYLKHYAYQQLISELNGELPKDVSFIFGHTHKPFEEELEVEGYFRKVKIYNTGGWVIEDTLTNDKYGASIVFIDEDFNIASLRVFNETDHPNKSKVEISTADKNIKNPLYSRLLEIISNNYRVWVDFSNIISDQLALRVEKIRTDREKLFS